VCACKCISVSRPQQRHSGGGRPGGGSGWHGVFRSVAAFPPPRKQRRRKRHPLQRVSLSPPPLLFLSRSLSLCNTIFCSFPLPYLLRELLFSSISLFYLCRCLYLSLFSLSLFLYRLHCPHLSFFLACPLKCSFFFICSHYSSTHHPSPFSRM